MRLCHRRMGKMRRRDGEGCRVGLWSSSLARRLESEHGLRIGFRDIG